MQTESIKRAYRRYAGIYDALFGPVLHPGRKQVLQAITCQPGDRILEVGVGTGLSLPLYPRDVRVTGIDLSGEMLARARERVARELLSHVEALLEMDAEDMNFPPHSFDKVVAMYVVSVARDPARLVAEMRRVCRPGGDIFIVNHFRAENAMARTFEDMLSPLSAFVGFRPNMDLEEFLESTGLEVVRRARVNLFDHWTLLQCRNRT